MLKVNKRTSFNGQLRAELTSKRHSERRWRLINHPYPKRTLGFDKKR